MLFPHSLCPISVCKYMYTNLSTSIQLDMWFPEFQMYWMLPEKEEYLTVLHRLEIQVEPV